MYDAVIAIAPEAYGPIINGHDRNTMNYEQIVHQRAAFIRLRNENEEEQRFIRAAAAVPAVSVFTSGALAQIVFPAAAIPGLEAMAGLRTSHRT